MTNDDKKQFAEVIAGIGVIYDKQLNKQVVQLYFNCLADLPIETVQQAAQLHINDSDRGRWFPKPADFRYQIDKQAPVQDRALLAWDEILNKVRRVGAYGNLRLEDKKALSAVKALGGWRYVCSLPSDKLTWAKREFIQAYETYDRTPPAMLPDHLAGITEQANKKRPEQLKNVTDMKRILNKK